MGTWSDRNPTNKEATLNTASKVFPDAIAGVVVLAASALATKQAGNVISGSDLLALYTAVLGYVFGKAAMTSPSA